MANKIDTPLHMRPMVPAEPEMMRSDDVASTQLYELRKGRLVALDEYVHWDPATGTMVKGPKPTEGDLVPTGGSIAVDTSCRDCGANLQAGHKWPTPKSQGVYYLICSRLVNIGYEGPMPEPEQDTVVECGNYEPPEPEPAEAS